MEISVYPANSDAREEGWGCKGFRKTVPSRAVCGGPHALGDSEKDIGGGAGSA